MSNLKHAITKVASITLAVGGLTTGAAAAVTHIQTYKDNNTLIDSPDTANPATNPDNVLNGFDNGLGYMAFDLSSLPENARITAASFTVADMRTSSDQFIRVDLLDVPADWDETGSNALTWNQAVSNYGAVVDGSDANVDQSKVQWDGKLKLDADTVGGLITAVSEDAFGYTDSDLIDALNTRLVSGDGQAVFAVHGIVGRNNYIAARENTDGAPATLNLAYEVPEPASLGLLGLGSLLLVGQRRRVSE